MQTLSVSEYSASHDRPSGDWKEKAADGNRNWFQKEIRLGHKSAPDTEIVASRPGGGCLTAEGHTRSKRPTG